MIITKQKNFDEIVSYIGEKKKIFLIGCSLCAETCKTGGEKELEVMAEQLKAKGKTVTGFVVLDPACNMLEVKRLDRKQLKEIKEAEAILSFACGGGTQTILEVFKDIEVYPGNDTLFQGEITKSTIQSREFEQKCSLCGECGLANTGGICPVTRCPKGLLNGPCGGVKNGRCEIDNNLECVWLKIYDRLRGLNKLDLMKTIKKPKDNSKRKTPQKLSTQ